VHIVIADILPPRAVRELVDLLAQIDFADGRETAGWAARLVKNNEQAVADPAVESWRERIAAALTAHAVFQAMARPKQVIGPLFSRCQVGAFYGVHVDESILDGKRSDLSFTLFLSEKDAYDGGELVLDTPGGEIAFKESPGSLVLYPATTLHRVTSVTRGTRHVAAGWVRSHIRRADQRELLFDLETARQRVFAAQGKTAEFDLLSKCAANLMRMWCDD
jgi:PKHD-type hydroxylase